MLTPADKGWSQDFGVRLAAVIDAVAAAAGLGREEATRKLHAAAVRHWDKELAEVLDRVLRRLAAPRN